MNFEILTVVQLRNLLLWVVIPSPGKHFWRFKGMYCIYLHSVLSPRKIILGHLDSWRWRHCSLKCRELLHIDAVLYPKTIDSWTNIYVWTIGIVVGGETFCLLISNFHHILYVVCFLLGNSPASEFYMPTFRNTVCSIFIGW